MLHTRHTRLMLVAAAYILGLCSAFRVEWRLAVIVASNCFFVAYLLLALINLDYLDESHLKKAAVTSDAPVFVIFLVTLAALGTALVSLFVIINSKPGPSPFWLALTLMSVPLGWATIHMMAAFHYAHLYWRPAPGGSGRKKALELPGGHEPDGWDFVYFAFVIGMTAQTADIGISGRNIRRFALAHAVVAYFFNAVLVAAAVNVAMK